MYRFHPRMQYLKQLLVTSGHVAIYALCIARFLSHSTHPGITVLIPNSEVEHCWMSVPTALMLFAGWLAPNPRLFRGISYSHNGVDLSTTAILRFEQDVSAHIQCSFVAAEHQVIEIVGSAAAVSAPLAFTAWRDDTTLLIQQGSVLSRRNSRPLTPTRQWLPILQICVLGQGFSPLSAWADGRLRRWICRWHEYAQ